VLGNLLKECGYKLWYWGCKIGYGYTRRQCTQ
jgi:hypothetical protein